MGRTVNQQRPGSQPGETQRKLAFQVKGGKVGSYVARGITPSLKRASRPRLLEGTFKEEA